MAYKKIFKYYLYAFRNIFYNTNFFFIYFMLQAYVLLLFQELQQEQQMQM